MKYENSAGIPETIRRALIRRNEMYDAGKVDTSVTTLISPPQITILRKKHINEMVREATDDFWALLGSGVHTILELGAGPNMIIEERLYADIDGWKISGALDVQEIEGEWVDIIDYKTTSVYSVTGDEPKEEWVQQQNIYAYLLELNKPHLKVRSLKICAILRDHSSSQAKRDPFYPQFPIVMIELPLWSRKKTLDYIHGRIGVHREARFAEEMDDELPECTPEERWAKGEKWNVKKKGGKRATKVHNNEAEALAMVDELGSDYYAEYVAGQSVRCSYCGCSQWCSQYARMRKDGTDDERDPLQSPE